MSALFENVQTDGVEISSWRHR